jgi:hypothetical protein
MFSESWLNEADAEGNFPTNGDRFAAQEVKKRQDVSGFTRIGFLCQMIAAVYHHKSAEQLKALGDKVGRNRIMVIPYILLMLSHSARLDQVLSRLF